MIVRFGKDKSLYDENEKLKSENEILKEENTLLKDQVKSDYYILSSISTFLSINKIILENTIQNEQGLETCTVKFKDILSFANYIRCLNDNQILFLKRDMEKIVKKHYKLL